MQTGFEVLEAGSASRLEFELVDLTTPEPRRNTGLLMSSPPIIDLTTPEATLVVDRSTPEPVQLEASVVDLSTLSRISLCQLFPSILAQLATSSKAKPCYSWGGILLYGAFRTFVLLEMVLFRRDSLAQGCYD
jgi:hypothetical protein